MAYVEHNGSGYVDPTVDAVIKRERGKRAKFIEEQEYYVMSECIKKLLDKYNYELEGPINVINMNSNRKRRIY